MQLDVVTHCWRYSRLLTYQLSSFLLNPTTRTNVSVTVFCAEPDEDPDTWEVLKFFSQQPAVAGVRFQWRPLEKPNLFRRAIGRNMAALETKADWVWFADCDMVFGRDSLDSLNETLTDIDADLVFPRRIHVSRTHQLGDMAIQRLESPQLTDITQEDFVCRRYSRAIGGVQIVRGDLARRIGYCNDTKHQTPTNGEKWLNPRGDTAFCRFVGTKGHPVQIPNVFRLRHSKRGQDHPEVRL
jgi:hypothetical protein